MNKFAYEIAKKEYKKLTTKVSKRKFYDKVFNDLYDTGATFWTNYLTWNKGTKINMYALRLLNEVNNDFIVNKISRPANAIVTLRACTAIGAKQAINENSVLANIGINDVTQLEVYTLFNSKLWEDNLLPAWVYVAIDKFVHKDNNG